jgi:HlyD family secretion protein
LQVHTVGGVIRPGEPLMDIVPEAQPLVLEAQVSPAHADDLKPGMRTEVRFTSFTGISMPLVFGEVTRVSADRLVDERSGTAYFTAEVTISAEQIAVIDALAPNGSGVRAGLPVEVLVPLRARTAMQYLLEPLNRQLWTALREN